jgi:predicted phage baseplate assembly protein
VIHHLRLIGYQLATAAPASTGLTFTVPTAVNETITIRRGDAFATKSQKDKPSVRFEYTSETPLTIDCSRLPVSNGKKRFGPPPTETPPDPTLLYGTIPVEEGRLIEEELVGISDGSPNQRFTLVHPRLILRSLGQGQTINRDIILYTRLGSGAEAVIDPWTLQESLAFSREGQRDFAIEIDELDRATILFGDGKFGAIPPANLEIRATYRVGGGTQGNVGAGSIGTLVDALQLALLGAKVTNPLPATGGADRESIGHAVSHAPRVFRSLKRAVTAQDYEALALDFKGVGKVRAEHTNWNTVTLFVAPQGGGQVSDVLRANLLAYFEDKRPVSTTVEIADVDYVDIFVTAIVGVRPFYDVDAVHEAVRGAVGTLLAFDNVDFGRPIFLSKFYEAIEALSGVAFVTIIEFRRADAADLVQREGRIELSSNEIARIPNRDGYSSGVNIVPAEQATEAIA